MLKLEDDDLFVHTGTPSVLELAMIRAHPHLSRICLTSQRVSERSIASREQNWSLEGPLLPEWICD